MSAKKRSGSLINSQSSFEMQTKHFGSRTQSTSSKTAWFDDVDDIDYASKNLFSEVEEEPYVVHDFNSKNNIVEPKKRAPGNYAVFWRSLRSIWKTRYTDDFVDQEAIVKTTIRELAIYLVFLIILCIVTFGMTSTKMYYFTKVMSDLFTGSNPAFGDVANMDDFFNYASSTLLNGLYWEQYYNGDKVPESEKGYIFFENKVLGRPRLRQVRVKNSSCIIHDYFKQTINNCYAPYSPDQEFKEEFVSVNESWTYNTEEMLNGRSLSGKISTYSGGGYVELLGANSDESIQTLANLKSNLWLDRGTRAVFIDFTVYNANINLFCIVTLLFEYPATGGCVPFSTFRTLKLLRYVSTMDHFVMGCEFIFVAFIFYYLIEEGIELKKHGTSYFFDTWNIFDLILVSMGIVCITFNMYQTIEIGKKMTRLIKEQNQYANFESLSDWQSRFNDFVAVGVFVAWIKVFKYVSFNKTMTHLQLTLAHCAKDIAGFAVMFFLVFLSYAQLGYLLFGSKVEDYSTYVNCIFTLFRIILGDFNFYDLYNSNPFLGPMFFITFVFFVFFILINMFLAIINDTYTEVKTNLEKQQDEFLIGDYFKKGYDKVMSKLSFKRKNIIDIQKVLQTADINHGNNLTFEEWRLKLKLLGHADAEIEAVFAKYDKDRDHVLSEVECQKMQSELEDQKNIIKNEIKEITRIKNEVSTQSDITLESKGEIENGDETNNGCEIGLTIQGEKENERRLIRYQEYTMLAQRVQRMEHSIGSIVSKVESVLLKLEMTEKAKSKRRKTLARLLDVIVEQNGFDRDEKSGLASSHSSIKGIIDNA